MRAFYSFNFLYVVKYKPDNQRHVLCVNEGRGVQFSKIFLCILYILIWNDRGYFRPNFDRSKFVSNDLKFRWLESL